ncbi:MAG: tyrosine phosphatase family protein [Rhodoplanes sp.]|jgi:predicted protein tyrosine phosphatase
MIHVCSLARLHETVTGTGASHIVTLINKTYPVSTPEGVQVDNHLWLDMDDICSPLDGYILPQAHHVERLLSFVRAWDRTQPLVVHCHAGISRSSAAAFVSACALAPNRDERMIALAVRKASPTALPNTRIVSLADQLLGRNGRMTAAIAAMSPYTPCYSEALPFRIDLD